MEDYVPGFMVLDPKKTDKFLKQAEWTPSDFADALEQEAVLAYAILSGRKMNEHMSRKFFNYFTAEFAQHYIYWDKMGMLNPYPKILKMVIHKYSEKKYKRRNAKKNAC